MSLGPPPIFGWFTGRKIKLATPHYADVTCDEGRFSLYIPAGFESDGATVPRWAWVWLPAWDRYSFAALFHDYLLQNRQVDLMDSMDRHTDAILSRRGCDNVFFAIMRDTGVGWRTRWTMYLAVRLYAILWRKK
jgi:hypothetical protein